MANGQMRRSRLVPAVVLVALVAACAAPVAAPPSSGRPSPARTSGPPGPTGTVTFVPPMDTAQAPRYVVGQWSSSVPLLDVQMAVTPEPPFSCIATLDAERRGGDYRCAGLLPASADVRLELTATTTQNVRLRAVRDIHTMGEQLGGVPWFTEFEDPNGAALACAAASIRIIQAFTTGRDVATARSILIRGRPLNKSADPGLDPAAIAAMLTMLEPTNRYHYYRFPTRTLATGAAVYWLARSAKPVIALSLAGQHAPVITGYTGVLGSTLADPATRITGLVVEDPQRGDLDPATAQHRPEKSRSSDFQTGAIIPIADWYADDWWFRDAYTADIIFNSDGKVHDVDRRDAVYPKPHWNGMFVILVDDDDSGNPSDREGRVAIDGM